MSIRLGAWRAALEAAGFDVEPGERMLMARRDRGRVVETVAVDPTAVLVTRSARIEQGASTETDLGGGPLSIVAETVRTVTVRWECQDTVSPAEALGALLQRAADWRDGP